MRKVLVVGQGGEFNLEGCVSRAFSTLGWTVVRVDLYRILWSIGQLDPYVRYFAARSYGVHRLLDKVSSFEEKLGSIVHREKPDLILVFKGELFPSVVSAKARELLGTRSILWFPDDPRYMDSLLLKIGHTFDQVVVSSPSTIEALKEKDVRSVLFLPFACDPSIHDSHRLDSVFNVVFVGSYYPRRANILSAISEKGLKIWGRSWGIPWIKPSLRASVIKEPAFGRKYVDIMNMAKIVVNIHHRSDFQAAGKFNMRTFEAAGCGTFQLIDKIEGIESLFVPNREIVGFKGAEDLKDLVEYYLDAKESRDDIGRAARERAHKEHTYVNRVSSMLKASGFS